MSYPGESSVDARVRAVQDEHRRRLSRVFAVFALVEVAALVLAVLLIYVMRVVDEESGVWILFAIAFVGAGSLSVILLRLTKERAQAVARARGENPLF